MKAKIGFDRKHSAGDQPDIWWELFILIVCLVALGIVWCKHAPRIKLQQEPAQAVSPASIRMPVFVCLLI